MSCLYFDFCAISYAFPAKAGILSSARNKRFLLSQETQNYSCEVSSRKVQCQ